MAACRRRVVHHFAQGAGIRVLKMDRPDGRRVLKFDGLSGRGLRIALTGNAYKVSVTDSPFCVIWQNNHSAELSAFGRYTPYPAQPDFPRKRGQNKTPRNTLFINGSTVSTGYCATACGGKVVAPATKGGMPEWYMKYMTLCFSPQISCFPLRGNAT